MESPAAPASSSEREALIAAWQTLGASQPLCHELQNLLLMHMRRASRSSQRDSTTSNTAATRAAGPPNRTSGDGVPPQRYTRRARSVGEPPAGPSKPAEVTEPAIAKPSDLEWANVAPGGPAGGRQRALCEDMDRVFRDINTLH